MEGVRLPKSYSKRCKRLRGNNIVIVVMRKNCSISQYMPFVLRLSLPESCSRVIGIT